MHLIGTRSFPFGLKATMRLTIKEFVLSNVALYRFLMDYLKADKHRLYLLLGE